MADIRFTLLQGLINKRPILTSNQSFISVRAFYHRFHLSHSRIELPDKFRPVSRITHQQQLDSVVISIWHKAVFQDENRKSGARQAQFAVKVKYFAENRTWES